MKPLTQEEWEKLERIWYWLGSSEFWLLAFPRIGKPKRDDLLYNVAKSNCQLCREKIFQVPSK